MTDSRYPQFSYEPEADVAMWQLSADPIAHAKEVGNFIIHFSPEGTPVLVELLEAKRFADALRVRLPQAI